MTYLIGKIVGGKGASAEYLGKPVLINMESVTGFVSMSEDEISLAMGQEKEMTIRRIGFAWDIESAFQLIHKIHREP